MCGTECLLCCPVDLQCFPGNCLVQPVCLALLHPVNAAVPGSRKPCLLGTHRPAGVASAACFPTVSEGCLGGGYGPGLTAILMQPAGTAGHPAWIHAVLPHNEDGDSQAPRLAHSPQAPFGNWKPVLLPGAGHTGQPPSWSHLQSSPIADPSPKKSRGEWRSQVGLGSPQTALGWCLADQPLTWSRPIRTQGQQGWTESNLALKEVRSLPHHSQTLEGRGDGP
jgi:hypothetical protein